MGRRKGREGVGEAGSACVSLLSLGEGVAWLLSAMTLIIASLPACSLQLPLVGLGLSTPPRATASTSLTNEPAQPHLPTITGRPVFLCPLYQPPQYPTAPPLPSLPLIVIEVAI